MKSILILSLLFVCVFSAEETKSVELESASDIIAIVKCFLGKEELITDVKDIIAIIQSGDYSKLITVSFKVYADVTAAIKECVPQEQLQMGFLWFKSKSEKCMSKCRRTAITYDRACYDKCMKN